MFGTTLFKNASCLVAVGKLKTAVIVAHLGGDTDDKQYNFWDEEISICSCDSFEDVFDMSAPETPGLWVWEGTASPNRDDPADLYGEWRPATSEDVKRFQEIA